MGFLSRDLPDFNLKFCEAQFVYLLLRKWFLFFVLRAVIQTGYQSHWWDMAKKAAFSAPGAGSRKEGRKTDWVVLKKASWWDIDMMDLWPRNQTGYLKAPYLLWHWNQSWFICTGCLMFKKKKNWQNCT